MMLKKWVVGFIFCLLSLCCLLSCGLEAFYYIENIPDSTMTLGRARIDLPSSSREGYDTYFTNFIIYYRIYISANNISSIIDTSDVREQVNRTLNTDFNNLLPYTDITNQSVNTANLENTFLYRSYFKLAIEEEGIDGILGKGALGRTLEVFFDTRPGVKPYLTLDGGGSMHFLQRVRTAEGTGKPDFFPKPDTRDIFLTFFNHPELYDNANAVAQINADTANYSNQQTRYTYVSMYIAARGLSNETPPRYIYSQPVHVGVFKLTDYS